ncbi:MAG: futalosine hydrolase [Desulfobia sp.]
MKDNYLLVASTDKELSFIRRELDGIPRLALLRCGVGPVEAAYNLCRYLAEQHENLPSGVINFGIGGAYPGTGIDILDFCLATREVIADLGVCDSGVVNVPADPILDIKQDFRLNSQSIFKRAVHLLTEEKIPFREGGFVTLNCASGTASRGEFFRDKHQALCENMEGAALARVCTGFVVDFLELRTISNMVEDRVSGRKWRINEACDLGGRYMCSLVLDLLKSSC